MKKILIVSDSHRRHIHLEVAIDHIKPDVLYHLGDGEGCEAYLETLVGNPIEIVRGNCDVMSDLPLEVVMRVGAHVVMLTHGHTYYVNYGREQLAASAKAKGADWVFYGHTHIPEDVVIDGVRVINPGSISYPRQYDRQPGYGVLTVDDAGELSYAQYLMRV